jgi:hypothetical protein
MTDGPACKQCNRATRYVRARHSTGTGWHLAAWCTACNAHANPERIWLPQRTLEPDVLALLPDLYELERAGSSKQLAMNFAQAKERT